MKHFWGVIGFILLIIVAVFDLVMLYIIITPVDDIERAEMDRKAALYQTCKTERCKAIYGEKR